MRLVTLTGVLELPHNRQVSGRPPNFKPEQLQALRRALKEYDEQMKKLATARGERWSQELLGDAIGVSQQVAGRIVSDAVAVGLSYPVATAIAALEGFKSVDDFFADHTKSVVVSEAQRGNRDLGIRLAQRAGVSDATISEVLSTYAGTQYDNRPVKWWVKKFIDADEDRDRFEPPPTPQPPKVEAAPQPVRKPRQRKTG